MIQVRIPSVHGAYGQKEYMGQTVRNYVQDDDLPYYQSALLPSMPSEGQVAVVATLDEGKSNFLVIGLMGASYTIGGT